MNDTDNRICRALLDVVSAHGVKTVVCSPGSRNAPLLLAAAARQQLKKYVIADERSAAFAALGIAATRREPVALICTSGTAVLNYAPAVAEAFYQSVPLIIISADRPRQWIDQDDSQTIRQDGVLANIVKKSYDFPAAQDPDEETMWMITRLSNDAMIEALSHRQGPVHINVRLSEPLGGKTDAVDAPPRIIRLIQPEQVLPRQTMRELADTVIASKVLVVAGFMPPDHRLNRAMEELAALPNVYVMAETISNLHIEGRPWAVDVTLASLSADDEHRLAPNLIISLGGALVSRKIKEYLRRCRNAQHWSIGYSHTTTDCFKNLTLRIEADRARFIHQIAALAHRERMRILKSQAGDYKMLWEGMKERSLEASQLFLRDAPWSELKAFETIFRHFPTEANLHLSNGTSIRYSQLLLKHMPHACFCNRGVSGIDGATSTAIGSSLAFRGLTVLITGDMSFAYDISALNIRYVGDNMRIIVIGNAGGGIFRFIGSTAALEEREPYFCADPQMPAADVAQAYGWRYLEASDNATLSAILPDFFSSSKPKSLLLIHCPPEESATILKNYFNQLSISK